MRLVCILLSLFLLIYFTPIVQAATPSPGAGVSITFSEVSACEENEWIELYNSSDQDVTLTGWKIEKKGEGASTWSSKPVDTTIATISAKMYKKTSVGSSFLSNSGFSLRLKDSAGDIVDENVFAKCPSGSALTSWIKDGEDWKLTTSLTPDSMNTLTAAATPTPTVSATPTKTPTPSPQPKAEQSEVTTAVPTVSPPATQPTTVSISEVSACQEEGEKEWVELYNSAGAQVILTDWKLTDADSNDQPISSLALHANGYASVEITKYSRGMLTNSGDTVNLIDGNGKNVDTFSYKSCSKGKTWQKGGGIWQESSTASKGFANPAIRSTTPSPQPEGDGEDVTLTSALGPEESSASGFVLGTQDVATPSTEPSPLPTIMKKDDPNWLAYGSIGTGIVLILATAGYLGFQKIKNKRMKAL